MTILASLEKHACRHHTHAHTMLRCRLIQRNIIRETISITTVIHSAQRALHLPLSIYTALHLKEFRSLNHNEQFVPSKNCISSKTISSSTISIALITYIQTLQQSSNKSPWEGYIACLQAPTSLSTVFVCLFVCFGTSH